MVISPQFPDEEDQPKKPQKTDDSYLIKHRQGRKLHPISKDLQLPPHARSENHNTTHKGSVVGDNSAVELIRRKLDAIYGEKEPDARQEIAEVSALATPKPHRSKHQQFMYELSISGKSLAQIQTEWHNYYVGLSDEAKHEVWREFYANSSRQSSAYTSYVQKHGAPAAHQAPALPGFTASQHIPASLTAQNTPAHHKATVSEHIKPLPTMPNSQRKRAVAHIKKNIVDRVLTSEASQRRAKQHLHSLIFGLGTGFLVLIILLFGFFNEMFIAPFIQPSRHVSATPIIVSTDSAATSETPEIIIPKINVQIPVIYDEPSVTEASVQRALERGVIHYASTVNPGEQGNTAVFGHSSNNIFNKGKYKFAFVLLHELVPGDIFYLTYNKTVYTYRVFDKKIVPPTEVSILNGVAGKPATATLITCDPPGTSTNRLVVWGEQISPDPAGAATPTITNTPDTTTPTELPSEGPTLWSRFWNWMF